MNASQFNNPNPHSSMAFETSTAATIDASADSTIETLTLNGLGSTIGAELENTGANALDAFLIEAQAYPGGAWFTYISSAEFNTGSPLTNRLLYLSTNPTTLASAGKSHFGIIVLGLYAIRFRANAAAGGSTAKVRGVTRYGGGGTGGGGGGSSAAQSFQTNAGDIASPADGSVWYDSTAKLLKAQSANRIITVPEVLYAMNTTDTQLINPTSATDYGTASQYTFAANSFATGQVYRIQAAGTCDSGGAFSFTPKILGGASSVYNTGATLATGSNLWQLIVFMRITAAGAGATSANCNGVVTIAISTNTQRGNTFTPGGLGDPTTPILFKMQGTYGTSNASNITTCTYFQIERLR